MFSKTADQDACHHINQTRSTRSKQPYASDAVKTKAIPDSCKSTKTLPARKKRSRSVIPKDRSPLIPGDSRLFSQRTGRHWMDGCLSLIDLDKLYMRPWDDCIPSDELSLDNLPPFFVRLRDDQVGAILDWLENSSEKTLPQYRVNQYWPHDISAKAWFVAGRENWGKPHKGKFALPGGPTVPSYIDMGLPPTFMSSAKAMRCETGTDDEEHGAVANGKRKAGEMLTEKVQRNGKRICTTAAPGTQKEPMQAYGDKIAALEAEHKSKVDVLAAEIASKKAAIAYLQRQNEEARTKSDIHDGVLLSKDTQIERLNATLQDKTKLITDLENSIAESRVQIQRAEAKHKHQANELQILRKRSTEESQKRNAVEEKQKKKEVKDTRKELKARLDVLRDALRDAVEQAKSYEEGRDKEIAQRDGRIKSLEAQLDQGKASIERCREFLRKELGGFGGRESDS